MVSDYCILSDPWTSLLGHLPNCRPGYRFGQRIGSVGKFHPHIPTYATHEDALSRNTPPLFEGTPPLPALDPSHYTLTPADVMNLRASLRNRIPDVSASSANPPTARYNAHLDAYELVQNGTVICHAKDIAIIGACLRGERFEPGYIKRLVSDTSDHPEAALLDADERERRRRERASFNAKQALARREAEEAAARARLRPVDAPEDIDLDDLFT